MMACSRQRRERLKLGKDFRDSLCLSLIEYASYPNEVSSQYVDGGLVDNATNRKLAATRRMLINRMVTRFIIVPQFEMPPLPQDTVFLSRYSGHLREFLLVFLR